MKGNEEGHMTLRSIRAFVLLGMLAAAAVPVAASDESGNLEGSWSMTITATEPPGLPPFKGLITFTREGEVLESRRPYVPFTPFGPVLESSGHGAWARAGRRAFAVAFQFLIQAAPHNPVFTNGEDLGTDNIRLRIVPSSSGETFTGTFASAAKDAEGNVVFEARGTVTGTRLRATQP
jgi:hypothetical protein